MANAYNTALNDFLRAEHPDYVGNALAERLTRTVAIWLETNSPKYRWFGDTDPCSCGEQNPEAAIDNLAGAIRDGESPQHHSSCGSDEDEDEDEDTDDDEDTDNTGTSENEGSLMAKTLRTLLMEELGTDNIDVADSVADIVLDWLQRCERNHNLGMASMWRERTESNRQTENSTGQGM